MEATVKHIIDTVKSSRGEHSPDTLMMSSEWFWEYNRCAFKVRVGEHLNHEPITLRNPFTGDIFWMQN